MTPHSNLPVPAGAGEPPSALEFLATVPEHKLWLADKPSAQTRRAYAASIASFARAAGVTRAEDFGKVTRAAVIAWREELVRQGASAATVNARLSALGSLFKHLTERGVLKENPVKAVARMKHRVTKGKARPLTSKQARRLLDAPPEGTLQGLRDRAILSVGLQAGPRRAEIAKLNVRDFKDDPELPTLEFRRKGGSEGVVVVNPQTANRIRAYLKAAGHAEDKEAPLFLPVRENQTPTGQREHRHLEPGQVNRIMKRWCRRVRVVGLSSHSMRSTFITEAIKNGARIEDVQLYVGHAQIATTQRYNHRDQIDPERCPAFFAVYGDG
jgi:site-specific recombinase XerD